MPHKPNFTAELTNKAAVQEAAASIGCTHSRGREKGTGSIRAMLEEIGQGEVLVMFQPFDHPNDMRQAAENLRQIADGNELISALANSLDNAARIKQISDDHFLAHMHDE
jgi:hypothetical protein